MKLAGRLAVYWIRLLSRLRVAKLRFKGAKVGKGVQIFSRTTFYHCEKLSIGDNVAINDNCWFNAHGGLTIGSHVLIGPNVVIHTANHVTDRKDIEISRQGHRTKPVTIDPDVWIGANATVLPGVTLARGTVVGAGAVVTKTFEGYSVLAGVPATRIAER